MLCNKKFHMHSRIKALNQSARKIMYLNTKNMTWEQGEANNTSPVGTSHVTTNPTNQNTQRVCFANIYYKSPPSFGIEKL